MAQPIELAVRIDTTVLQSMQIAFRCPDGVRIVKYPKL